MKILITGVAGLLGSRLADWIIENLPFDRLYFYGSARPLHVSFGPSNQRSAFKIQKLKGNKIIPKSYKLKANTV